MRNWILPCAIITAILLTGISGTVDRTATVTVQWRNKETVVISWNITNSFVCVFKESQEFIGCTDKQSILNTIYGDVHTSARSGDRYFITWAEQFSDGTYVDKRSELSNPLPVFRIIVYLPVAVNNAQLK